MIGLSQSPLPDKRHSQETEVHDPGWIRTRNPRKPADSIYPYVLNLDMRRICLVSFTPRLIYLKRQPQYRLDRRLGGPYNQSRRGGGDISITCSLDTILNLLHQFSSKPLIDLPLKPIGDSKLRRTC